MTDCSTFCLVRSGRIYVSWAVGRGGAQMDAPSAIKGTNVTLDKRADGQVLVQVSNSHRHQCNSAFLLTSEELLSLA